MENNYVNQILKKYFDPLDENIEKLKKDIFHMKNKIESYHENKGMRFKK